MNIIIPLSFDDWFFGEDHLNLPKNYFLPWQEKTMRKLADDPSLIEYIGALGQRGGTTTMLSSMSSFFIAKAMLSGDLAAAYGTYEKPPYFTAFVVAHDARHMFRSVSSLMLRAGWFKDRFVERRVLFSSGSDSFQDDVSRVAVRFLLPSQAALRDVRGETAFFAAIDNPSWMRSSDNDSLSELGTLTIIAARNAQMTCRSLYFQKQKTPPKPMLLIAGSPRDASDPLETALREAKDKANVLTERIPTWDMNPSMRNLLLQKRTKDANVETFIRDFGVGTDISVSPLDGQGDS